MKSHLCIKNLSRMYNLRENKINIDFHLIIIQIIHLKDVFFFEIQVFIFISKMVDKRNELKKI